MKIVYKLIKRTNIYASFIVHQGFYQLKLLYFSLEQGKVVL